MQTITIRGREYTAERLDENHYRLKAPKRREKVAGRMRDGFLFITEIGPLDGVWLSDSSGWLEVLHG